MLPALERALRWTAGVPTPDARLASLLSELLPALGSWCAVDVLTADGALARRLVLHVDEARRQAALELQQRFSPHPGDRNGPSRVVRSGQPELVVAQPDTAWIVSARDAAHLALLRTLGTHAYVILPLVAAGTPLGAITFVAHPGGEFEAPRYALAEAVAAGAALLLEQAQRAEHGDAETRQRAMDRVEAEERLAAEQRRREAAEEASRAKSAYLAALSHEIRTPLTSILGYAELLRLELAPTLVEPQHGRLLRLEASCRHLLDLVGGLLDFASIEAGQAELDAGAALVAAVVDTALDIVRPQAEARGVALCSTVDAEDRHCFHGDVARVRQILVNLLVNAVKFTPAGGTVTVACGTGPATDSLQHPAPPPERGWCWIRVSDTGVGIPDDELTRVFDPFVRGTTALHGGVGLGLTICRELARRMQGDVTVASRVGDGAVFTVWLPLPEEG